MADRVDGDERRDEAGDVGSPSKLANVEDVERTSPVEADSTADSTQQAVSGDEGAAVVEQGEHDQAAVNGTDLKERAVDHLPAPAPTSTTTLLPSPMEITIPSSATIEQITSSHGPESPTTSLIASLRSQLTLLSDQSNALNTKLIQAIGRHADLEDSHIALQSRHTELEERANVLAGEKARWEDSMNTGLLVERAQIKDEMQRLAAGLVEEERRRGSAETRRQKVEEEVDELAASLFDQANTMVATERMARTSAETRLKETEDNLAAAESAMRDMQLHLQSLPLPSASPPSGAGKQPRRYLSSHMPYSEFISFVTHLRSLRPLKESSKAMFPPPAITTLLAQPFIARTITEDHDPAIRLDAAPDLSYFSRRTVGPAIIAGELIVEPVSASTVLSATTAPPHDINCSLCGKPVFPLAAQPQSPSVSQFGAPPVHPTQSKSRFSLKPFFNAASPSTVPSPSQSPLASPSPAGMGSTSFGPVYVFRVNRPNAATTTTADKEAKLYPLCKSGWCLERLRASCELWHFVRTGVIQVVWHGDDGYVLAAEQATNKDDTPTPTRPISTSATTDRRVSNSSVGGASLSGDTVAPPPLPERKKSGGWGLGFKLGGGSGSGSSEKVNQSSGWFGRSGSATPPRSPVGLPPPSESAATEPEKEQEVIDAEKKLDDPIDITPKESGETHDPALGATVAGDQAQSVPRIEEHEASPAPGTRDDSETIDAETGPGLGLRPAVSRTGSSHSISTSAGGTDENTFSTPKGQGNELPDEDEVDKTAETSETAEEPKAEDSVDKVDAGSPAVVDLTESAQPSPVLNVPPPVPKRSANRLSRVIDPTGGSSRDEMSTPVSPVPPVSEETDQTDKPVSGEETTKESTKDTGEEEIETLESANAMAIAAPPPLPPRHPITPNNPVQPDPHLEGEKRWMKDESDVWEEKTWRMILRLKEGMWKARVGVSDEIDG